MGGRRITGGIALRNGEPSGKAAAFTFLLSPTSALFPFRTGTSISYCLSLKRFEEASHV